jgi:hypothetical protein
MTVTATTSRVSYAGNGSTKTFAVPFYFLQNADLVVIRRTSPNVDVTLTLTTDYTVAGAGNLAGGSITLTTAPSLTQTIVIYRDPPVTQITDYQANDPFPAETHERALDKLTMIAQRLKELGDRSFRLSDGYSGSASTALPDPEANKVIGWNPSATALQNYNINSLAPIVNYGTTKADVFTGTGAQVSFTLTGDPGAVENMDVSVGGVTQIPTTNYTVSGTTLTFATAPPNGVSILARYTLGLALGTSDSATAAFSAAGVNAIQRTARDKMREVLSVKDFGAIGDGIGDDAPAIINAVSAAYAASADLYIPPGVYLINSTITLANDNLTIYGAGWQSIIKKNANIDGIVVTGNSCVLRNFAVDGNGKNASGVGIKGADNRVVGVRSYNNNAHGIYRDGQSTNCFRNVVENCFTHDNNGIGISCNTAPNSVTIGCVTRFNGLEGITDDLPSYRSTIVGNYVGDNCQIGGVGGIGVDQASNSVITGNVINNTRSSKPGIGFQNNVGDTNYCTVTGNSIINNTGGGIDVGRNTTSGFYSFENVFSANVFQNNTSFDIRIKAGNVNNVISGTQPGTVIIDETAPGDNMKAGFQCNFRVFNNTLRTDVTGDGTAYTIPFNGITKNRGSYVSGGTFTAPVTGVYQLNANVRLEGGSGQTSGVIAIVAAGTSSQTAVSASHTPGGSGVLVMNVSDLFYLNKNATVTVEATGIGGSKNMDIAAASSQTWFSGTLVG